MILHHRAGLRRQVTHKAWFSRRGWYSCFSRCLLVSRIHLPPFQFLSCIPCLSFLFSISSCPGNKSLRPHQKPKVVPSAVITVLSSQLLLTIILHLPAFMRSPTLLEIFSTSSVISCIPICDVSMRAISENWQLKYVRLKTCRPSLFLTFQQRPVFYYVSKYTQSSWRPQIHNPLVKYWRKILSIRLLKLERYKVIDYNPNQVFETDSWPLASMRMAWWWQRFFFRFLFFSNNQYCFDLHCVSKNAPTLKRYS